MPELNFIVGADMEGQRIDRVLATMWPQRSRADWNKAVRAGMVKQNDTVVKRPSMIVSIGTEIQFADSVTSSLGDASTRQVPIIYEDEHLIIVNKPAGMLTHAKGSYLKEHTIASVLADKISQDGTNRAGIVHRLDRLTSGILVLAKDQETKKKLQGEFSKRRVNKTYIAFVDGTVRDQSALLTWPIKRNPKIPSQFIADPAGKSANTQLQVMKQHQGMCEVELMPSTGRTHQLRVHMLKYGNPILGDPLYAPETVRLKAPRMCLHASSIEFTLEGKRYVFNCELPEQMADIRKNYA